MKFIKCSQSLQPCHKVAGLKPLPEALKKGKMYIEQLADAAHL